MNKFNEAYEFILKEINRPIFKMNRVSFNSLVKQIINEDYHIFPVPKLLLDDIELLAKQSLKDSLNVTNEIIKKEYLFIDLLEKYTKDWNYYNEFIKNVKELTKRNKNGKIICCVIINEEQIENIISIYKLDASFEQIYNSKACIFNCQNSKDFNACLCINTIRNITSLRKCIQHELIHWMQISLNVYTKTSRGIFNDKKFNLLDEDLIILSKIFKISKDDFIKTYEYLLDGMEFEAWVANTCEEFEKSNLSINEYDEIIKSNNKLNEYISLEIGQDENKFEMFLFGKICYMSSMNDKNDDRYQYLIEALKENKQV